MTPNIFFKPQYKTENSTPKLPLLIEKKKMEPGNHLVITQPHSKTAFRKLYFNTNCYLEK